MYFHSIVSHAPSGQTCSSSQSVTKSKSFPSPVHSTRVDVSKLLCCVGTSSKLKQKMNRLVLQHEISNACVFIYYGLDIFHAQQGPMVNVSNLFKLEANVDLPIGSDLA